MVIDLLGLSGFGIDFVMGSIQVVWNFQGSCILVIDQVGLMFNIVGLIINSDVYLVEMVFKFIEFNSVWWCIFDVQNWQSDNGFYVDLSNNLDIYLVVGGVVFMNDVYYDVFFVNNVGVVIFYFDGFVQVMVIINVMNFDVSQMMNFFLDNVVVGGQGEYLSGSILMICVYDQVLNVVLLFVVLELVMLVLLLVGLGVVWVVGVCMKLCC